MSSTASPADAAPAPLTQQQASAMMSSRPFVVLLVLVAVVGVVVSLASWCFLELIHQIQQEVFVHLPHAFGYSNQPRWWPLPVLPIAAFITAFAIARLPGRGGHIPADGLATGGPPPTIADLSSVLLAAFATIGLGLVLGPEAPLIALGSGLGAFFIRRARKEAQPQVVTLVAAAGSFAAVSFVFSSPLIAAVILIEASGIGGARLPLLLVPGLLAAGIGSLVSLGMGSFTGLSTKAYALSALPLPNFTHPDPGNFAWSIALAIAIAAGAHVIMRGGKRTYTIVSPKPFVLLPIVGLVIAGLAIAFSEITGKGTDEILFSGQDQLPGLVSAAGTYSVGALALVVGLKGIAYSLSLGSFRGGPTFPILFIGAAAGIMASHLPGFELTAAVAVGMGAGVASVLRLPLTAVVTATVLTAHSGVGAEPLVIVAVVVAYVVTLVLSDRPKAAAPAG
ncbi:MAG TPA: chloride channel protein [Solirubrobacteraceae bacterium]|nr:chloride channel protein [Solirubrobacteraceae bacterium]